VNQTHISFIFDEVAELFEARDLRATFAVLVDHDDFMVDFPKGNFEQWNQLQQRGHEIHPHGWDHSDLSKLPYLEATQKIDNCLEYFSEHLKDFDAPQSVYHLTYNRSTPEVDHYLLERVKAIRTTGPNGEASDGLNSPDTLKNRKFSCSWYGPDHCDAHLRDHLKNAEASDHLHFCYMLHGLDDEGWGPIHKDVLADTLDTIHHSPHLTYTPIGQFAAGHLE